MSTVPEEIAWWVPINNNYNCNTTLLTKTLVTMQLIPWAKIE